MSRPFFFLGGGGGGRGWRGGGRGKRARWNLGKVVVIVSVIPTVSCSAERSQSVLRRPKTDQKHRGAGFPPTLLVIERAYVNRVDNEKVIDKFSSKKVRFNQFLHQKC